MVRGCVKTEGLVFHSIALTVWLIYKLLYDKNEKILEIHSEVSLNFLNDNFYEIYPFFEVCF